ncbi:Uncharacterized membrane protein [Verrucomicrobium sp. GAS474]|uniref:DUF502 domain-containing protein n=1 Tax=Verrucomicrobium sp. GAS474 TaxID=1882831 RepID=UPI00087BA6CB|nr:DUF502 domain-containing protein [Verrucomicrobium sp. GAS474]SDU09967.1 Uncharacterized membrane protein [Verrucomicrobium sp. GAS474]
MPASSSPAVPSQKEPRVTLLAWFRDRFLAGLFTILPLVLTWWLIQFTYNLINGPADRFIRQLVAAHKLPGSDYFLAHHGGTIPGAGFVITILLILLVGILAGHFLGRQFLGGVEALLLRIPVVKGIYQSLRQAVQAVQQFGGDGKEQRFRQVVYVKLSGMGELKLIGFVTGQFIALDGTVQASVFVPHAPSPLSGLLFVIPQDQLIPAPDLTVEQAMKMVLSLGLITPGSEESASPAH